MKYGRECSKPGDRIVGVEKEGGQFAENRRESGRGDEKWALRASEKGNIYIIRVGRKEPGRVCEHSLRRPRLE